MCSALRSALHSASQQAANRMTSILHLPTPTCLNAASGKGRKCEHASEISNQDRVLDDMEIFIFHQLIQSLPALPDFSGLSQRAIALIDLFFLFSS